MRQNSNDNRLIRNIVIVIDFIILNALFYFYVRTDAAGGAYGGTASAVMLQLVANTAFVIAQFFFSNVVHNRRSTADKVLRQVTSLVFVFFILNYFLTWIVVDHEQLAQPRFMTHLWLALMLYVLIIASRLLEGWVLRKYHGSGHNIRRVVFVGSDATLKPVYDYLSDPSLGYDIMGYYADSEMKDCPEGLKYLGTLADFAVMAAKASDGSTADELYCSLPIAAQDLIRSVMSFCNNHVVHFYYVPPFTHLFGRSFTQEMVGETAVFTDYGEPLMQPMNQFIKRTFDIVVSSCVLLCMLPFIPIIALIIKMQSPGPLFFKQLRTGLNGHNFYCYKFRSMHVNKDADLVQATEHDPRKFAFGNFMRKANIDELPQFFNVLKGDMSIVGPRPHMLHHTEVYRNLIDKYMVRHFVRPGITGWAQVTGYRGETKELWQMEGRVKRDIWYIEHWSIWLDLLICWKTAKQVFVHDEHAY